MEGDPNVASSSSSATKKRKRKKTSPVWDEMTELDIDGKVKAECKHCKKLFPAHSKDGTTHLRNHLERCRANPKRKGPGGRDRDDQDQSLSPLIKTKDLASLIKENSVYGVIKHLLGTEMHPGDQNLCSSSVLDSRKDEILQLYEEEKEKLRQRLNNLSCRFSLQIVGRYISKGLRFFLVVYYIDDIWERKCKIISFWQCPCEDFKNLIEAAKQSCLDWNIDRNICSLFLPLQIRPAAERDNQIGKMESWFSQRASLPFAGLIHDASRLMDYFDGILDSEDYFRNGLQSLKECVDYVRNKSASGKLEKAIPKSKHGSFSRDFFDYFGAAVDLKEAFFELEQKDHSFKSISLTKQRWDEVTATFEHLKFLKDVTVSLSSRKCDIPIIVDLQYVHKILTDGCDHPIEGCFFCKKVMKAAIDAHFSKHYLFRVIAVILDPRFKMDGLQLRYKEIYGSDADRYIEKINKDFRGVYDAYAAAYSSNSESYEMLDAMGRPSSPKSELDRYFDLLKVPRDKRFNILAWWCVNARYFPTLATMASDYLALEETSTPKRGALADLMTYLNDNFYDDGFTPMLYMRAFLT